MEMLEVHKDALRSSNVVYHEFLYNYKAEEHIIYGFIEGKDDPSFYRGLIENFLHSGWDLELKRAGNKDKVLKVLNCMDWARFSKKRICFFVDRDLSYFLDSEQPSCENLYVTNNYSIENDVVTFGTMKRVLEEILNITELNAEETITIQKLFESNLNIFRESIVPIMSQILIWRRRREEVDLDDIKIKKLFTFVDGKIFLEESFFDPILRVEFAARCANASLSSSDEIAMAEMEFRSKQGLDKFIRGKYLLWFFVEFAINIHDSIQKYCAKHPTKPSPRSQLSKKNPMVDIAPRVRCPESLRIFIERNYIEYIKAVELIG